MNWVDILLALVVLVSVISGWRRGFIMGSVNLLTWVGSFALAYTFYPYLAGWLEKFLNLNVWLLPVAFILTMIIARMILGWIAQLIVRSFSETTNTDPVNRFLGIIPGAINGVIYAMIISALLLALPLKDSITTETRNSRFAGRLAMQSEWINKKLAPVFDEAIRHSLNSLTIHPESDERVMLNFTDAKPVVRPNLETKMLELVNEERIKAGLKPLVADPELTIIARAHSKDMFAKGYFAHVNLEGKDPFDRMKEGGIRFIAAGENLALAQTLEIAHTNLMNSPGHRANILNPAFGRLGIGILDGGFYGIMISQEFRN